MWSAEDVARASVRRRGTGLSAARVADKVAEAARRERVSSAQLDSPVVGLGPYATDPGELGGSGWAGARIGGASLP